VASRRRLEYRPGALLVTAVLCLGFWQLGTAAYIPAKAWVAQELLQGAWSRAESGEAKAVPWPWADTWPVARLQARGGEVDLIVLAGDTGRTLAFGPGHMSASALPGDPGNSVIAGHRDTHFSFLRHLVPGDSLRIERPDGRGHLFTVTGIDVVDARRARIVLDAETPTLTLVTCYPFDAATAGGPMRYVVTAELVY
jgi:sortase A